MLTDSSLGKNNSDKCVAKMDVKKTLVLKFNATCDSLNSTMARDMMKIVVKEVNKGCHCGITRLHVKGWYLFARICSFLLFPLPKKLPEKKTQ